MRSPWGLSGMSHSHGVCGLTACVLQLDGGVGVYSMSHVI